MRVTPLGLIRRVPRSAWTWPLAALAALVILAINESAYDRASQVLARLGDRATARTEIQLVWRALTDAESAQRGYLLTSRDSYLAPYHQAVDDVRDALAWLGRYYAGDAEAAPVLARLQQHSAAKLSELALTLVSHDQGPPENWRELLLTDIGREKMEALRGTASQLLAIETRRVSVERQDVIRTLTKGRIGISTMTALSLLALLLFLRQTLAFDRAQFDHAQAMQAERDRLQAEATQRTADLTELARHLQTAREDERSRLARELHDELGALLTAAKLDAARLKRAIGTLTPEVQERLNHLNESINHGIGLKRRIIEDLRPSSLSNLGLVAALDILCREHATRSEVPMHTSLDKLPLTDSAEITVYRLVQEALTNIAKYASASHVAVSLRTQARDGRAGALVQVRDDGRGFDPGQRRGSTHGLMGMRYRVEAEGGVMAVRARPGHGTCIEAWLPQAEPAPVAAETAAEPLRAVG